MSLRELFRVYVVKGGFRAGRAWVSSEGVADLTNRGSTLMHPKPFSH
jgi:hypothetical protein